MPKYHSTSHPSMNDGWKSDLEAHIKERYLKRTGGMDQSTRTTSASSRPSGVMEGVARSVSQAAVFILDTQKTQKQVYGSGKNTPVVDLGQLIRNGMLTSILTSGCVFGTYYRVYYGIGDEKWYAGPCAALSTSIVKIPISNCMRCMQSGHAKNIVVAAKNIGKTKGWRGLYSGYGMSLLEDLIEFDTRARMYQCLRERVPYSFEEKAWKTVIGGSIGAFTGAFTAWMTTPFDTVRSQMAVAKINQNGWKVAHKIFRERGLPGLYAGGILRASSSALKSSIFFLCVEALQV